MSLDETPLKGTLKPDGTLVLDSNPNLPSGRVTVVLRPVHSICPEPVEDWWQYLQRSRRELVAAGATFLNEAEINAHIEWLREEDRVDEMLRGENS